MPQSSLRLEGNQKHFTIRILSREILKPGTCLPWNVGNGFDKNLSKYLNKNHVANPTVIHVIIPDSLIEEPVDAFVRIRAIERTTSLLKVCGIGFVPLIGF